MIHPRTILVSRDDAMRRVAEAAVKTARRSRLESLTRLEDVPESTALSDVALVIVHIGTDEDLTGVASLRSRLLRDRSKAAVLIVSDDYSPAQALEAIRLGAVDYLPRPIDQTELSFLVEMQSLRLLRQPLSTVAEPARPILERLGVENEFIYEPGGKAARLAQQIMRVAALSSTVMLAGETGVGKSRTARLIHELSPRRSRPMLTINCGALSSGLFESEMFGHTRGAFTGADTSRDGKFVEAGDGTLFLDEIDTLPLAAQAKLLRTVEERVFEPVGSNKTLPMKARLIVASNRRLEDEVKAGRFREDLFFRLNVITLDIPPLRERSPQVIRELCRAFVANREESPRRRISDDAMRCLLSYNWPGNVRELRNVLERALALSSGTVIEPDDLPESVRRSTNPLPQPSSSVEPASGHAESRMESREENEVRRIVEALSLHGNNRLQAAKALGISRMTLYNKLHKYGLELLVPSHHRQALL